MLGLRLLGMGRTAAVSLVATAALGLALLVPPTTAAAATETTLLQFDGDPQDNITLGVMQTYAPPDATFAATGDAGVLTLEVRTPGTGHWWYLWIQAPVGQSLAAGTDVTDAPQWMGVRDDAYHFALFGDGNGCAGTADFTIEELETDPVTGVVNRLAATFEQRCDIAGTRSSWGTVLYHATMAPQPRSHLTLTGPASTAPGETISVHGELADLVGPLAGRTLSVTRTAPTGTSPLPDVVTAADGSYSFTDAVGIDPLTYEVTMAAEPSHRGSVHRWGTTPEVRPTAIDLPCPMIAQPLFPLDVSGTLVDSQGPVAGASVQVTRTDDHGTLVLPATTTRPDGGFTVTVVMGTGPSAFTARFAGDIGHLPSRGDCSTQVDRLPTTLALAGPATAARGRTFVVTGSVTTRGLPAPRAVVTITRRDLAGVRTKRLTASAQGTFSFSDTPAVGGPVRFTAAFAGDTTRRPGTTTRVVTVSRRPTSLRAEASATTVRSGQPVALRLHLGTTYNSRAVTVYAKALGAPAAVLGTPVARLAVAPGTGAVARIVVLRHAVLTAVFSGDHRTSPVRRSVTVRVLPVVALSLTGAAASSPSGLVYRHGGHAVVGVTVSPARPRACVRLVAQELSAGHWRTTSSNPCLRLGSRSQATIWFTSGAPAGTPLRLRAEAPSDGASGPGASPWRYLTFR